MSIELLKALKGELQADIDRPEGRYGIHGRRAVDDDYFSALEYVVKRITEIEVQFEARGSAEQDGWRELIANLASDLESEINSRYGSDIHPAMARKYDVDMEIVLRARAVLSTAPTPPSGEQPNADSRRYARLRILGAAPHGTKQLENGTVLRFQSLDDFIDADIKAHPSRGEAFAVEQLDSSQKEANWKAICERTPIQNPDSDIALCIGVNEAGKPWFSIGHQKFTLDYDPAEKDQESARWYVEQLSAAFERFTEVYSNK